MKKLLLGSLLAALAALAGCTEPVPPGYLGKVVTVEGVSPEQYGVGRATVWGRDRLILIETSSVLKPAPVKVIMADRVENEAGVQEHRIGLEMDFIVNVRYRIDTSAKQAITALLQDMTLGADVKVIGADQVYNKYGNMVIGRVAREVLGEYTPEEVLGNLGSINKILDARVKEALDNSPLQISSVSMGPISLPPLIMSRIEKNKETELSEFEKSAQQKIDMLDKRNQIALARQQAVREEIDAKSLANQNDILKRSITPEVLRLRELQVREKEIEMMEKTLSSGQNNTVFVPYGAVDNTGAQVRMFQK